MWCSVTFRHKKFDVCFSVKALKTLGNQHCDALRTPRVQVVYSFLFVFKNVQLSWVWKDRPRVKEKKTANMYLRREVSFLTSSSFSCSDVFLSSNGSLTKTNYTGKSEIIEPFWISAWNKEAVKQGKFFLQLRQRNADENCCETSCGWNFACNTLFATCLTTKNCHYVPHSICPLPFFFILD